MLVVCTDCNGKWLIISKFNLGSSKQTLLALFFWFCFLNQYCLLHRQNIRGFTAESWLEGQLCHEDQSSRREAIWFRGVQVWEEGVLQPQLPISWVMWHHSPQLPVLVYLSYNLFGANSTLFVQCQAQSVPACHWCPSAVPQYKH